ncbi:MAG: glycosyltransferase [Spirochaetales bacterium]|nr:glycosyltransferase [Spirochaetales bacterium]
MSTIPSTSKNVRTPYTVAGGTKPAVPSSPREGVTVLLLHRGAKVYRSGIFGDLSRLGFPEIISMEGPPGPYDVEELARRYEHVRFIILHKEAGVGEQINIGMAEAAGRYVLVLWNDMKIQQVTVLARVVEKLQESGVLAVVPVLQNQKQQIIPSIQAPAFYRKALKVLTLQPSADGAVTLFPFDYVAVYNKESFLLLGGYDYTIANSYWQKMDFGFRTYMWGSRILCHTGMQFRYGTDIPMEDTTPDESYRRFFLKNLVPRFSGDCAEIPSRRGLSYCLRSGAGFYRGWKEFQEVRRWVNLNRYRFNMDARSVTELWELPEN